MTDFGTIRQLVDIRQAAKMYGLEVNRAGMARCIFHVDRNPSMKMYDDHSSRTLLKLPPKRARTRVLKRQRTLLTPAVLTVT